MEEKKYLLPYLRKGISKYIKNEKDAKSGRATIDFKVNLKGDVVSAKKADFDIERQLSLVGPADVKQIKPSIISQINPPAINTKRFNNIFMPFIEFYEDDFPWRYTPLPVSNDKQCTPWLVLVAVADDEYKLETTGGKRKVEFILTDNRYKEVFPSEKLHKKLAHVQLEQENDKEGVARLLCGSKLPADKRITVFLLPAFETGRLSGLGMNYDNTKIGKLSWADKAKEFPVYYHWSYYTSNKSGTFEEMANKLDMKPTNAYDTLKANLSVDIAESGLADDGLKLDNNGEYPIDVPVALSPALGKNTKLREEPTKTYKQNLEKELLLNPVFVENASGNLPTNEDPWVVPPVYGARHLLSKDLNGKTADGKDDVVREVNLNLRHRIAAGMGASVVKENQESFVHRAWQKVEKINELNQELREYYQMKEVEEKATERLANETASIDKLKRHKKLLTSDALPRTLNAAKLSHNLISVNDVRQVVNNNWKPVQNDERIIGITPDELSDLFNHETWNDLINSDTEEFEEVIAQQFIESYLEKHNWMQYLLMPHYNKATDPKTSQREICGIPPKVYVPTKNHDFITAECTDLFCWVNNLITDDTHTLNYYYNVAKEGYSKISFIFSQLLYDISSPGNPIYKAVYPVELYVFVSIDNSNARVYTGYIMHHILFKKYFGDMPYIAFEYNETRNASVKNEKGYTFLFSSDYEGLVYSKSLHFCEKEEVISFEYKDKDKECVILHNKTIPNTKISSSNPFTDNNFYKKILTKKAKDVKYDPSHPNMVYLEHDRQKFYIQPEADMGITLKDQKVIVSDATLFDMWMKRFKLHLEYLDSKYLCTPYRADVSITLSDLEKHIQTVDNYSLNEESKKTQNLYNTLYEQLLSKQKNFVLAKLKAQEPEVEPTDTPNLEQEKQDIIENLIKKYGYTEEAQLNDIKDRIEKNGLMKYPVMIYPDFLDPTFFYLRELSENYIIPSAGDLANNSVTLFQNNTAFEEAFLLGMNTEMGQELLWREYPTDQRGSYFRKFWVAAQLPEKEKLETDYFDIKKVHDWNKPLGANHTKENPQMLVFGIKGELMQAYPKTIIYLSNYNGKTIEPKFQASMAAWLTEDTYLVGFEGVTVQEANKLYLTFQEDITSLQFINNEDLEKYANSSENKNSAELGLNLMNTPSVFLLPINN